MNVSSAMAALALCTTYLYSHDKKNLSGPWILDDKGTISMNPVVLGQVDISDVWNRDFWGHQNVWDEESHKSWRPLCTLSYRWNREWANIDDINDTFWFHFVDRALHGLVTALSFPVAGYTFHHLCAESRQENGSIPSRNIDSTWSWFWGGAFLASIFFGIHPIHVEAVANSTGRAEVLMSLFYFLGFCIYAKLGSGLSLLSCGAEVSVFKSLLGVGLMLASTLASMLCKEHGVTLPIMCVLWDAYVGTNTSVRECLELLFVKKTRTRDKDGDSSRCSNGSLKCLRVKQCILFLFRTLLSAIGSILLVYWRLKKNGDSKPDFVCEQNPAACHHDGFIRFFHYSYLWCFNFWLMLYPSWLCPDWSGESIPLLNRPATDPRFPALFLIWATMIGFLYFAIESALSSPSDDTSDDSIHHKCQRRFHLWKRTVIICFFWMLIPFLMSSNLLVYVGFVVADRTLYLPSFGFCLLLIVGLVRMPKAFSSGGSNERGTLAFDRKCNLVTIFCAIAISFLYITKQQSQTKLWSDPVLIWGEAFRVSPNSVMNGGEYGAALVNDHRNKDAARVLTKMHSKELRSTYFTQTTEQKVSLDDNERKVARIRRAGSLLTTRFKLVTAMGNSGSCKEAVPLIEEGLAWIQEFLSEQYINISGANDALESHKSLLQSLRNHKSYLYVSLSRCSETVAGMAANAYTAVQANPQQEYAQTHAQSVVDIVTKIQAAGLSPQKVGLHWITDSSGQTATVNFAPLSSSV